MENKREERKEINNTINKINENIQTVANYPEQIDDKIDTLIKNHRSKLTKIMSIVAFFAALVTISGFSLKDFLITFTRKQPEPPQHYTIYLSSEYYRLELGAQTDITATLNFDTGSVNITAYVDSNKSGDTLKMFQKNETEWQMKVYFDKPGTHEVIATAVAPNGDIVEATMEIEVLPIGFK